MSFEDAVMGVVQDHPSELLVDLERSREALENLERERWDLTRRITALEWMTSLVEDRPEPQARMTLHDAMAEVLKSAPGRQMKPAHLAAEIERRGLYRMRNGRPVETQQIHARTGNYPHLFKRAGSTIELL